MSTRYAEGTTVAVTKSQSDIAQVVTRYGATGFMFGQDDETGVAAVRFRLNGRTVRFVVPLTVDRAEFRYTESGRPRTSDAIDAKIDAEIRRRWRALLLAIKAKLEVVDTGIATFEQEFLAHIELPSGVTIGEWAAPQMEQVYAGGASLPMLPGATRAINS